MHAVVRNLADERPGLGRLSAFNRWCSPSRQNLRITTRDRSDGCRNSLPGRHSRSNLFPLRWSRVAPTALSSPRCRPPTVGRIPLTRSTHSLLPGSPRDWRGPCQSPVGGAWTGSLPPVRPATTPFPPAPCSALQGQAWTLTADRTRPGQFPVGHRSAVSTWAGWDTTAWGWPIRPQPSSRGGEVSDPRARSPARSNLRPPPLAGEHS